MIKETAERALQLVATGREQAEFAVSELRFDLPNFTIAQMYGLEKALVQIESGLGTLRAVLNLASANVTMPTEETTK